MAISPDDSTHGPAGRGRPVLSAVLGARAQLAGACPERVWALSDGEVQDAMTTLGQLHASVEAQLAAVMAEAKSRGLGVNDGWGPRDWARMQAPGLGPRLLADLDTVAGAAGEARLVGVREAVAVGADPDPTKATDALPVAKAAMLVRFHQGVHGLADPVQLEDVTGELVRAARGHDGMSERELAIAVRRTDDLLRPDRLVEHEAEIRRAHRSLVKSRGPVGMWRYTMLLDAEGAAVVDAAVDALAKPATDPHTGGHDPSNDGHDPRTPAARRADALVELVRRAVGSPDGVPRQAKTSLVVTIGLAELRQSCRGAGLTLGGESLSIETVRRLACDAEVIPAVLGTRGEVLEQGRAERLFNRAQIRHLWLRDRHCSFPGCTKPATWCDAHHLIHWADGGPTDTDHGALLCQAHHTVVHTNRYAGEVLTGPNGPFVRWDLTPRSYDTQLQTWRTNRPPTASGAGGDGDGGSGSGSGGGSGGGGGGDGGSGVGDADRGGGACGGGEGDGRGGDDDCGPPRP